MRWNPAASILVIFSSSPATSKPSAAGKILFVADHDIDQRRYNRRFTACARFFPYGLP